MLTATVIGSTRNLNENKQDLKIRMRTSTIGRERSNSSASNSSGGSTGGGSGSPTGGNSRPQSVCDIVKAGYLHIKRPPTSGAVKLRIKTWQKRYFVLRDQSYDCGTALLDIFNTESGWHEGKTSSSDSYTIDLQTVKHVDEYTESKSFPNAFTITRTVQGPLILGAESDYDVKDWIIAIQLLADKLKSDDIIKPEASRRPSCPPRLIQWNSANQLHTVDLMNNNEASSAKNSPQRCRTNSQSSSLRVLKLPTGLSCKDCLVKVQTTEASKRNSVFGEYNMFVQYDEISLRRPGETFDVIKWPIAHIRKFKSEDLSDGWNIVTLDANVHCGSCSGTFLFCTMFGRKLIQKVKDALAEQDTHRDPDKDLDRLRNKCLNKAPSTPNLLNRVSPPKLVPKAPTKPSVRERTQSNPERSALKPNSYLHLLPEEHTESDAGDYIDDQLVKEPVIHPVNTLPVGTSPKVVKRRHSGLPPLPPLPPVNNHNVISTSPPNVTHQPVHSVVHSVDTASNKPPVLPPRRASGTPPPPPPRPQHTLSTHSQPV